jgi:hypothetical protein
MATVLGSATAIGLAAVAGCTGILGKFTTDGAGGAASSGGPTTSGVGAQGGGGSQGSAGQGGMLPDFVCSFDTTPKQIDSNESSGNNYEHLWWASGDSNERLFGTVRPPTGPSNLVVYDPGGVNKPTNAVLGVRSVFGIQRLTKTSAGALLYLDIGNSQYHTYMYEFIDVNPPNIYTKHLIHKPTELPASPHAQMRGGFVSIDDTPSAWQVDYFFSYQHATQGKYLERYGRLKPGGGTHPNFDITEPNLTLSASEAGLGILAYAKSTGKSYAYVGEPGTQREYTLDPQVKPPYKARPMGMTDIVIGMLPRDSDFNAAIGVVIPGDTQARLAKLPNSKLGKFVAADAPVAVTVKATSELPVGDGTIGWVGDVFMMVGGQGANGDQIGYLFADSAARPRGKGIVPFEPPLPAGTKVAKIRRVALGRDTGNLESGFGKFLIAVHVELKSSTKVYEAIYGGKLNCPTVAK